MANKRVVVIGAGFAGLAAASLLCRAGCDVVILEARNRIGGRVAGGNLGDYSVDLGAMWTASTQHRLIALVAQQGRTTFPTALDGEGVALIEGVLHRFPGEASHELLGVDAPLFLQTLEAAEALADLADLAPKDDHTVMLDSLTVSTWLSGITDNTRVHSAWGVVVHNILCCTSSDVSMLYFLRYVASGGGLFAQMSAADGGSQQLLVTGGLHSVAEALAASLECVIRLSEPVEAIVREDGGLTVITARETYRADRVILAVPPAFVPRIRISPPLPECQMELFSGLRGGSVIKAWIRYPRPFWREAGLNGLAFSDTHGCEAFYDATPPSSTFGVLVAFFTGDRARAWGACDMKARRNEVAMCVTALFGTEGGAPTDYIDTDWSAEAWNDGCFAAFAPPGLTTGTSATLRDPWQGLHFAGTETASAWIGYVEGALESGERAAAEILAALKLI